MSLFKILDNALKHVAPPENHSDCHYYVLTVLDFHRTLKLQIHVESKGWAIKG